MIYIFTAMYAEAHIFITSFDLKKVQQNTCFQQFYNEKEKMLLTVTGVGEIAAAAAVSSVCTQYKPGRADFLLNVGICAGASGMEGIFLVHKLTEQATGKTFYPDMLYRHCFQEAEMVTGMRPVADTAGGRQCLYDMEGAAVYQAGAYFFAPHQMLFLKLVSDHGSKDGISGQQAEQLMTAHRDVLLQFPAQLVLIADECSRRYEQQNLQEEEWVKKICLDLHGTKVMHDLLRQQLRYLTLTGADYKAVINRMYEEGMLPCRDKKEGKKCFAELKKRLF